MSEEDRTTRTGFVGLGVMGEPMAGHLLAAGYPLTVFNRTPAKAERLRGLGAHVAPDLPSLAAACDVVFTMLPTSEDVERIVIGDGGLMTSLRPGALVVDMSTISPITTRRVGETLGTRGIGMIDAPVSGGDVGAVQGTLSIMAGGTADDFERALPLFRCMGRTIVHMGPAGAGQLTKAANQIVVGLVMGGVAEAIVLAERGGVTAEKLLDVLQGGLAANQVIEVKRPKYLSGTFEPGGRAELHLKDLGIALSVAREVGVILPHTALLEQLFQAMKRKGWGVEDHAGILHVIEDLSGG